MDLNQILNGPLANQATQLISQQLNLNEDQAQNAVSLALPTLLNALTKNASSSTGAESLFNAISKDHSNTGDISNNLANIAQMALSGEGNSILKHILGGNTQNVENALSNNTGVNTGQAAQILQILAPIVLKALGNQTQQQGLNANGLASLLNMFTQQYQKEAPKNQSIISQLLDQNGDGNVADDAVKIGMGFLGKLFKK